LVAGTALVGFAVLLVVTNVTQGLSGHFLHHVVGMWLGLAISGSTITFFVHRLAGALARQRGELERTARAALEAQHLASLGALAAGAAHELGTPLGTIQLLADELDEMDASERASAIQNMRREVSRCKRIVHDMATPELSAQHLERSDPWPLTRLVERYQNPRDSPIGDGATSLEDAEVSVEVSPRARGQQSTQPRLIIQRTLDELVKNGLEACRAASLPQRVGVRADVADDLATIRVEDCGPGLDPQLRESAFAAFSSTKESGRGLGLFLARAHLTQLGGTLELADHDGVGARFVMRFPLSGRALTRAAVHE
jgi:two-component system sensor histidine kinase RegB